MRGNETWRTWRRQLEECVLLPAIAAALPWPLAWRVLQALAVRGHAFGDETAHALATCSQLGFAIDVDEWMLRHRLTRIIDQVDPALSATRGDGWMDRYVAISGDALPPPPCIFVGFHYGTGFWSLRHFRRKGHRVAFISASIDPRRWHAESLRLAFMNWRLARVARDGGEPIIYVGGSSDRIRAALRRGTSVLALIDVPEPASSTVRVNLLDQEVELPDGILRIGREQRVPLLAFVATLASGTGERRLRFTRLPDDPEAALLALVTLLDRALREDPASWHFWAQWFRFRPRLPA